jgi:DNA-binding FrmR family transcriptional regulator
MMPRMAHTVKDKKKVTARIGRIRGQLNAVERAVLEEKDCYLILQTTAACRGALNSLMAEILEGHIRHHLVDPGPSRGADRRKAAREVIAIVNSFLR